MAKKVVKKNAAMATTHMIDRRYEVWGSVPITADSFEEAVEIGKKLTFYDFDARAQEHGWIDVTTIAGFGIREEW